MEPSPDPVPSPDPAARHGRRTDWRQGWRRWLPRAAFESALIVFSVILAMAVTGWVEDRRTAARVQEMRGFLKAEIRANRNLLRDPLYLPHHLRLKTVFGESLGSLDAPVSQDKARAAARAMFSTGLHTAPVRSVVWNSISTGDLIEHMDPREVFAIAEIYEQQAALEGINAVGYDASVGLVDMLATGEQAKPRLMKTLLMLEDMTAQERRLIALYDQVLASMEDATSDRRDAPPAKS